MPDQFAEEVSYQGSTQVCVSYIAVPSAVGQAGLSMEIETSETDMDAAAIEFDMEIQSPEENI